MTPGYRPAQPLAEHITRASNSKRRAKAKPWGPQGAAEPQREVRKGALGTLGERVASDQRIF